MNKKIIWAVVVVIVVGGVMLLVTPRHKDSDRIPWGDNKAPSSTLEPEINTGEETPIISSITPDSTDHVNTAFTIKGTKLNGFEGGTVIILTNNKGQKGYLEANSYTPEGATTLKFTLPNQICTKYMGASGNPCPSYLGMSPGVYKITVRPWSKESNELTLTIRQ